MNIGTLTGHIVLNTQQFTTGLNIAANALSNVNSNAMQMSQGMMNLGRTMTIGLTLPIVAATAAAAKFSGEFEESMTRLTTVANVSKEEIGQVTEEILKMAPAVGIGPQALADAMTKVSSTVQDTAVAMEILKTSAQGTKAGFGETVDVAGALTSVINSYGKESITAGRAADVMAMAIKLGGAEAKELAPTLANVVPFAAQMGVTFEEVAANFATMTELGVPASEAITTLTSVFSAMAKETRQGSQALEGLETSYADLRKKMREEGLAKTLTDLMKQTNGDVTVLHDIFGRIEAMRNIMGTAGEQAGIYAGNLNQIKHASDSVKGAMQEMADEMTGKQLQTWRELNAQAEVLAIRLGDLLKPAIKGLMDSLDPLLEGLTKMVELFKELPGPVQALAGGFVALMAAAGPFFMAVGGLSMTLVSVNTLMGTAGLAGALGVIGPVAAAAAVAVGGVVLVVKKYLDLLEDLKRMGPGGGITVPKVTQDARKILERDKDKPMKTTAFIDMNSEWMVDYKKRVEETAGGVKTLTQELADAKRSLAALTEAQKADIAAAHELNLNYTDTAHRVRVSADGTQVSVDAVRLYIAQLDKLKYSMNAVNKEADEQKSWKEHTREDSADIAERIRKLNERSEDDEMAEQMKRVKYEIGRTDENMEDLVVNTAEMESSLSEIYGLSGQITNIFEKIPTLAKEIGDNLHDVFEDIPRTLARAFTGGGGLLGAMKGIGVKLADAILGPLMSDLGRVVSKVGSGLAGLVGLGGSAAKSAGTSAAGGAGGAAAAGGMSLGAGLATAGIGAAAVGVYVGIKKLMDQRKEIKANNMRDDVFAMWGNSLEVLNPAILRATGSLQLMENLFAAKREEDVEAAYRAITDALEAYREKVDEARSAHETLLGRMSSIVEMSPELEEALQRAYDPNNPEDYLSAIEGINGVLDEQAGKQELLNSTLEKYGLTWKDTGEKARVATAAMKAGDLIKDFNVLNDAGVDINNIMRHMGDNISDFLVEARLTGTEVPEAFRDIAQKALNAGELFTVSTDELKKLKDEAEKLGKPFDEAKYKVTDLKDSGIIFGTTMERSAKEISSAMDRLIAALDRIAPAATIAADTAKRQFDDLNATLETTEYHIDGITNGHSPTGLKDIAPAANIAGNAMHNFGNTAANAAEKASKQVDKLVTNAKKAEKIKWNAAATAMRTTLQNNIGLASTTGFAHDKLAMNLEEKSAIADLKARSKELGKALPDLIKLVVQRYDIEMAKLISDHQAELDAAAAEAASAAAENARSIADEVMGLQREIALLQAPDDFTRSKMDLDYAEQDALKDLQDRAAMLGEALPTLLALVVQKYDLLMEKLIDDHEAELSGAMSGGRPKPPVGGGNPVGANVLPFVAQNRDYVKPENQGRFEVVVPFNADGREIARAIVRYIPTEAKAQGFI